MKTWKIPVTWGMMGFVKVEAPTLKKAIKIAEDKDGVIPIPDDGNFRDGTWEVDCNDMTYIRAFYNDGQEDENEKGNAPVMRTLGDVLQQQFDCEKPFLDDPYYDAEERAPMTLTAEGSEAYTKLINLVYTLGNLTGCNVNQMVDQLDRIASEL